MTVSILFVNKPAMFFDQVNCLTCTTKDGVISVYSDHENLYSVLDNGYIEVESGTSNEVININSGILIVEENIIKVFVNNFEILNL